MTPVCLCAVVSSFYLFIHSVLFYVDGREKLLHYLNGSFNKLMQNWLSTSRIFFVLIWPKEKRIKQQKISTNFTGGFVWLFKIMNIYMEFSTFAIHTIIKSTMIFDIYYILLAHCFHHSYTYIYEYIFCTLKLKLYLFSWNALNLNGINVIWSLFHVHVEGI